MRRKRILTVALAVLLALQPAVAPAMAADDDGFAGDPCGRDAISIAVDVLSGDLDRSTECRIEEIKDGNKEQEKQDTHARALTMNQSQQATLTAYNNAMQDAETVAWTKAELAILDALEDNATETETQIAARNAIKNYTSRMMLNVIADRNSKVDDIMYLNEVRQNESLNASIWRLNGHIDGYNYALKNASQLKNHTFYLPNGTAINQTGPVGKVTDDAGTIFGRSPAIVGTDNVNNYDGTVQRFYVESTYNDSTVVAFNGSKYQNVINDIQDLNQRMLDNANTTASGLYGSYVRGELNVSEYRSVQATAVDSASTYSIYSIASLARAGTAIPDLNETDSITIEWTNSTGDVRRETGLIAGTPPNGSWVVGNTYDPANINATLSFHVSGTNESLYLTDQFDVISAEDKNGDPIDNVSVKTYNYRTANYSELGDKLDLLIDLRHEEQERIEEASTTGSSGGWALGDVDWSWLPNWLPSGPAGGAMLVGGVAIVGLAARTAVKLYIPGA